MYSLIIYLNKLFNSYNSCFDFYLKELSRYISLFEIFNCLILCFILFSIFIRFLIKRYTLKKVIFFILKRIFIAFIFFILFSLFPIFCDNSVISKLFDTNTKKVCIATIAITGCYLSYKYIPIYYKTVISHKNYIESLKKKEVYNIELKEYNEIYLKYLEKLDKHKNLMGDYNCNVQLYKNFIININTNFTNIFQNDKLFLFFNNSKLLGYNTVLNKLKCDSLTYFGILNSNFSEYDEKFLTIYNNILNSSHIIKELNNVENFYKINDSFLFNQNKCFQDLYNLMDLYNLKIIPTLKKFTINNNLKLTHENIPVIQGFINEIEILLNQSVDSSNLMLSNCNSLKFLDLLIEPVNYATLSICNYKKPIDIEPINFPIENLEGFRYIGINIGYVVFYPILYSSNKILGTYNPLSSQSFMDAISNLISLIKFF